MKKPVFRTAKTDFTPFLLALVLALFGLVMIHSASSYSALRDTGDALFFVRKQGIGLLSGLIFYALAALCPTDLLKKLAYPAFGVSLILLGLVFVPGLGVENYGARRWLNLGIRFQPSEIAKFTFVLAAAAYLSSCERKVFSFWRLLPVIGMGGATCILVIIEPNMSITVCIALVMLVMLFVGGMRVKHLLLLALPMLLCIPVLIAIEPYRLKRLVAFLDPFASPKGEGYQLIQSLYALGSGGWFGVGLGNSRQKFEFLPFGESDFIFSVIGEELGLIGCIAVLALFLLLIWRGVKIALSAKNRMGCYLALGITAVIAVQTMVNVAVVTGSIPPTGLPLPFISYGGSSLTVFFTGIGILQRVSGERI